MSKISTDDYFDLVMDSFPGVTPVEFADMTVMSESKFKVQWFNQVYFTSYIAYADYIDAALLLSYMNKCQSLQRKGLLRMIETRVCNSVVICDRTYQDAIDIALMRPRYNMSTDTFPVIVDLKKGAIYYYNGPMATRLLYNRYEREYIDEHFGRPLRDLSKKYLPNKPK